MKLTNGTYAFQNVGEPPIGWMANVDGDILVSSQYGTFEWSAEERCYINNFPTDPDTAEIQRLYVYANGSFAIISLPVGQGVVVGTWS